MADSKNQGVVRRRGDGTWGYRLEKGVQPCQVCPACKEAKRRPSRHWLEGKPLASCPRCGGELVTSTARRQDEIAGCQTEKEAKSRQRTEQSAIDGGTYVESPRRTQTVREYLEGWLRGIPVSRKASTVEFYRLHVESYIIPRIGSIQLRKLTADHINAMYAELITDGRLTRRAVDENGEKLPPKPLSRTTVRRTHASLHKALHDAVKRGHLGRNPADAADIPKATKRKMTVWTAEQARSFLEATEADRMNSLWRLLLDRGLRRAEACGLKWADVDFDAATLAIRDTRTVVRYEVVDGDTKNATSTRSVSFNAHVAAALKAQATRQGNDAAEWGEAWTDTGYVFTAEDGKPIHPDRVSKLFDRAVKAAKLPRIRLHDTRHTCATLLLKAGVHPKVVQELLGHATIAITMDLYSHVLPGMQEDAAELMSGLLAPVAKQEQAA
jgi:integrase